MGIMRELELYSVSCDVCKRSITPEDCVGSATPWWKLNDMVALSEGFLGTHRLLKSLGWSVGTWKVACPACSRRDADEETIDKGSGKYVGIRIGPGDIDNIRGGGIPFP